MFAIFPVIFQVALVPTPDKGSPKNLCLRTPNWWIHHWLKHDHIQALCVWKVSPRTFS